VFHLKNKFIFSLFLCITLAVSAVHATESAEPVEYNVYSKDITLRDDNEHMEHTEYKEIQLDREIYINATDNLRDIRIVDEDNNYVPYLIYDSMIKRDYENTESSAKFLRKFNEDETEFFDFEIMKNDNIDVYGNRIELIADGVNFAKDVTVYGSYDGIEWSFICNSLIYDVYNVDKNTNMSVEFNEIERYNFFRVGIPNNKESINLNLLKLIYENTQMINKDFRQEFAPDYKVEEVNKETHIIISESQIRNLNINTIFIDTDSTFKRGVSAPYCEEILYNLPFKDVNLQKTYLNINRQIDSSSFTDGNFIIVINNKDDKPININGIKIEYSCDKVLFKAESGKKYSLVYGDENLSKPSYDIESYADLVVKENADICELGIADLIERAENAPVAKKDYSELILNVVVAFVSVVLMVIIILAGKKKSSNNAS